MNTSLIDDYIKNQISDTIDVRTEPLTIRKLRNLKFLEKLKAKEKNNRKQIIKQIYKNERS